MGRVRLAARKDGNHAEIIKKLRQIGAYVLDISQLPDCCDIFTGYRGRWVAFEIKDPIQGPSGTKLTPGEQRFFDEAGYRAPVYKIYSFEEALDYLTGKRK